MELNMTGPEFEICLNKLLGTPLRPQYSVPVVAKNWQINPDLDPKYYLTVKL